MKQPTVSIVTPSYNQAEYLEDTIKSVLNQDYPNIEYIIIDGGSTDGSIDIIKKYENKLAYWVSEKDSGQCEAINKGFSKATGDIYNWLNSDDILMPNAVSIAVHYLQNCPQYGMVFGERILLSRYNQVILTSPLPSFSKCLSSYKIKIPSETAFFRKDLWLKAGKLNEDLHYSMDVELWYRFLMHTTFYHIPFVMGGYRIHDMAKSYQAFGKNKSINSANSEVQFINKKYKKIIHRLTFTQWLIEKYTKLKVMFEWFSSSQKKEIEFIKTNFVKF